MGYEQTALLDRDRAYLNADQRLELISLRVQHSEQIQFMESQLQRRLETLTQQYKERVNALNADLQKRYQLVQQLQAQTEQIKAQHVKAAEVEIDLMRRQFENEKKAGLLAQQLDFHNLDQQLKQSKMALVDEFRPVIEGPLLAEIGHLNIQLAKMQAKFAQQGKSSTITREQLLGLLTHDWGKGLGPISLRLAGQSGSGKSHFINQVITGGLFSLGVDADFTILDPFGSDTDWATKPSIYNEPERAAEMVREWADGAKGSKLQRPSILVLDEADTMIADYHLGEAVKSLVKLGRHRNRFLYLLGQNGNCIPKFQWSDIRNMAQIYLGEVGTDYCENGLKGRHRNTYLGELEALKETTDFYAICKRQCGGKPFTVSIPKVLFPHAEQPMHCPKCHSANTKKAGTIKGRQRIYCHDCGKQSYAPGELLKAK